MAELEHIETGERVQVEGEIPFGAIYKVEGYDEEADEYRDEERVRFDGEEYIVIDDGVDMVTIGDSDSVEN